MSRFWRTALALILPLVAMGITGLAIPQQAHALCIHPKEAGNWVNTDPNTRSITRVEVQFICHDVILNGTPPGPSYYVHLYGKCHPTDCDWGKVSATRLSSGNLYAFYDQGFAKRHVYLKMSQYRAGQLWVAIKTDFTDPNRADYESQDWFKKV